jgi:hypothetical protein
MMDLLGEETLEIEGVLLHFTYMLHHSRRCVGIIGCEQM